MPIIAMASPRPRPRRVHHRVSLTFSTPDTMSPQLYEWVSTGFPFPVSVYHYSISSTHPPPPSVSSASAPLRISPSLSPSEIDSVYSNTSILAESDELVSYTSSSESLVEGLRRRLQRVGFSRSLNSIHYAEVSGDATLDITVAPLSDPWTTWSPPTPPLRPSNEQRPEPAGAPLIFSSGTMVSTLSHDPELDAISEVGRESRRERVGRCTAGAMGEGNGSNQVARAGELCEILPNEETDFAQGVREERSFEEGISMCWACRSFLRRCARRRSTLP